jgi:hypothetical protein
MVVAVLGVIALAFVSGAAPALARGTGGGGKSASTITVEYLNADGTLATDGTGAHYGGQVTFQVSTTVTDKPMVELDCYQGGTWVYWSSAGFYPGYPWPWAQDFTLQSSYWTGGAADCTARLYYSAGHNKFPTLATVSFPVAA